MYIHSVEISKYMSQVNVRIPKEIEQDFERYKGSFNVSEVCQTAIAKELDFYKRVDAAMTDKDARIAQLRQQRQNTLDEAYQEGRLAGAEDFKDLGYQDIQVVLMAIAESWDGDRVASEDGFDWLPDTFIDTGLAKNQFDSYVEGWLSGVSTAWDEISQAVEAA
jgi:hypothetical protein